MENVTSAKKGEEEKFTLIDSLITAMFIPREYNKLLKISTGKVVRYVIVLLSLVCVIQYAIPALGAIAGLGGMEAIIMNEFPEFSLEDGTFYLEERIEQKDEVSGIYTLIDTSVEEFTREDVPENMMQVLLVSKHNILVYNAMSGLGEMVETNSFENIKDISLSNQSLADMSGLIYLGLFFVFLLLLFGTILMYLLRALFFAVMMFLIVKVIMQDLTFKIVYKTAIFAQTIGILVEAVTYSIGGEVLYMTGSLFGTFVTVHLMNKAMLGFVKKNIE